MLPHIALYLLHKKEIDADLLKVQDRKPTVLNLIKACTRERSFRNLFYYRMGEYRSVIKQIDRKSTRLNSSHIH